MKDASTLPLPSLGWSQHDTAPPTRTTSNVCSRCNCSSPARFLHLLVPTSSIANQHQRLRLSLLASKLSGEPVRHPYLWRSGNSSPVKAITAVKQAALVGLTTQRDVHFAEIFGRLFMRLGHDQSDVLFSTQSSSENSLGLVLRESDAARVGIRPRPSDYTATAITANGKIKAARATIDRIELGGITVYDVPGMVLPDEALAKNLLGVSFLSRLKRYEYANGRIVLEQ